MTEPFIISDTHFGHANVLEFERENRRGETIAEHDQWLVSQMHSQVIDDPRYVNCCVEQCGGVPRTLEEWTA